MNQIFTFLALTRFYIGILAVGKDGNENFYGNNFTRITIDVREFFTCKVNINLITSFMLQFHGSLNLGVFTLVMLHKLGVPIRIVNLIFILFVVMKKSKSWVITRSIDFIKVKHQIIISLIVDGTA